MGFIPRTGLLAGLWFVATLLLSCAAARLALADGTAPSPIDNNAQLPGIQIQLQALVNTMGFHKVNHFCVLSYDPDNKIDPTQPYIYWPTQNKLIVLGFGSNMVLDTTDYWDLKRDILPDGVPYPPQDIKLPWRQSDVDDVVHDCRTYGNAYTIIKTNGGWVPINKFPAFSSVNQQLQYLVDHQSSEKTNSFCIIGQKDGPFLGAYVFWHERDQLIFWLPSPYDVDDLDALADAAIQIDVRHSLRAEEDGQNYRNEMQRSYADAIIEECQKSGQRFTVVKSN